MVKIKKTKCFNKDVNRVLLMLIAIHIVLFSAFTVYYQMSYSTLQEKAESNKAMLDKITNEMVSEQLQETSKLKQNLKSDRQAFEDKYYEAENENEQLKSQIKSLQNEVDELKIKLDSKGTKSFSPYASAPGQ
ncbi:MAG TPA: hypothetical protein VI564_01895 [Candidatus Nanoarchaeia archaeon]|nr:hypothetical protein [Candidatus Nanoarchaeia archaeon]